MPAFATFRRGIFLEDWCTGEAKQLRQREKLLNGRVRLAKLGAVAFIEDEDDPLAAQWLQSLGVVCAVCSVERDAQLLDRRNNHLVSAILREHPVDQRARGDIFFHAVRLEAIELLPRLGIEVFAIDDKEDLLD